MVAKGSEMTNGMFALITDVRHGRRRLTCRRHIRRKEAEKTFALFLKEPGFSNRVIPVGNTTRPIHKTKRLLNKVEKRKQLRA